MKKALIAMSGGVDSSVAALLTQRAGYTCIGCTMRLFDGEENREGSCCSLEDVEDARSVAYRLGMNYYVFNFTEDFRREVMLPFAESYLRGETPNPCIRCNAAMKFSRLLRRAEELGCECLVTGHYARIVFENGEYRLKRALDEGKDQSYVLYMLTQDQLARLRFPLGELTKAQARALAEENGFVNAAKPDSQDICFVPGGDYAAAVAALTGRGGVPGDFVDATGKTLGRHRGIERYTVGQRRGLGLSFSEPMYVRAIDPEGNRVVLGREEELFSREVLVRDMHWISGRTPDGPLPVRAKLRYRHKAEAATATPLPSGGAALTFESPQRAAAPGQAAVLYDAETGETVLGGGTIAPSGG